MQPKIMKLPSANAISSRPKTHPKKDNSVKILFKKSRSQQFDQTFYDANDGIYFPLRTDSFERFSGTCE